MTRPRTPSHLTAKPSTRPSSGITREPPSASLPPPPTVSRRWPAGMVLLLVAVAIGVGAGLAARAWLAPVPESFPVEEQLLDRFMKLHKANDPAAADLLGPAPRVPDEPISPEEARRLQADFFLREKIEFKAFSRKRFASGRWYTLPERQFVLVAEGHLAAPEMAVRTDKGVKRRQRTMFNPDLIVEVKDGKIHGVRAELHEGP